MKAVIQRVKEASVSVEGNVVGRIQSGMLVFLGVGKDDSVRQADLMAEKLVHLRIFEDEEGRMNRSALDCGAEFLVVSQFTLLGDCRKGRRPSFDGAADPQKAEVLYQYFVECMRKKKNAVETGQFRAMMDVRLTNDGPVTFILET